MLNLSSAMQNNTPLDTYALIYLIAGLGNPGREFRNNRHNFGFMALDRLAHRLGTNFSRLEVQALVTKTEHSGHRLILVKPQTYMNLSGKSVSALIRYYKAPPENLLVVYDDVDLPFGTLRLRPAGSSGGQKGMNSVIEQVGRDDFPRLRLGVGRPPGRMPASAYVLQDFSKAEAELLPEILDRAVDAILAFVVEGLEAAMTQYNGSIA